MFVTSRYQWCRPTSNIWININRSKEQFNEASIAILDSENKGRFLRVASKVWVDAVSFQEPFNEVDIS
jgi:hypothetical protein